MADTKTNTGDKPVRQNEKVIVNREFRKEINGVDTVDRTLVVKFYELKTKNQRTNEEIVTPIVEIRSAKRKYVEDLRQYVLVDSFVNLSPDQFEAIVELGKASK